MKIAFLTDPPDKFKIEKDTTFAMMREAARRGYAIFVFEPKDMAYAGNTVVAQVRRIHLTGLPGRAWYQAESPKECRLNDFDVVLQRKDPPFDMEYVYATYLLEIAESSGARIFNKPAAIRNLNEKLGILEFAQFITPTLITSDDVRIRRFHGEHQTIILKPLDGMGGTGVFKVGADGLNLGSIIETLTLNGTRTIMVQRFIPDINLGDKRILLIGGQVVPFSLARVPQGSEVRGNLAVGGLGVAQPLSANDMIIAQTLAPILNERGLLLVGCDVIGDFLTEINVTSPTCFQEISQQTGFDVAAVFIDALEQA